MNDMSQPVLDAFAVDPVVTAARAAVAGWTLGSSQRQRQEFGRLNGFDPIPKQMSAGQALDAWIAWSDHLRRGLPPVLLAETRMRHLRLTEAEGAYGEAALRLGFRTPVAGRVGNPLAEGSQAIGRALYWGLAFSGDPERAARHALYDAACDHAGDGVSVPVAFAAVVAGARPGVALSDLLKVFTQALPSSSRVAKGMPLLLTNIGDPDGPRLIHKQIRALFGPTEGDHAALSALYVWLGLLHGAGDPATSLLLTAGCGGEANHTAATTATIATLLKGEIAKEWVEPLGDTYVSASAVRDLDPPAKLSDWIGLIPLRPQAELALTQEDGSPAPIPAPSGISNELRESLVNLPMTSHHLIDGLKVDVHYLSGWEAEIGRSLNLQLNLTNLSREARKIEPRLTSVGWETASRLAPVTLDALGAATFPAVVKPTDLTGLTPGNLKLALEGAALKLAVQPALTWHVLAPLANADGAGYDRMFPAETKVDLDAIHNGRSDLPVKWETFTACGPVYHLESLARGGPCVIFLYARLQMPAAGHFRMFAAVPSGVKVWINGERRVAYYDHHQPPFRPEPRYSADFVTDGEVTVLIKVMRDRNPLGPLCIGFFDEAGQVALPVAIPER